MCSGETPLLCGVQAVNAFNQTPLGVRLVGTQQAIGGGLQMVTGGGMAIGGLAICAESLGAGCGLGALGAMNFGMGLDNARSGVGAVWDGTPKGTLGGSVISAIPGVSPDTAEAIYGQANLAVGLVTSGVTIGRGSVPAVTSSAGAQGERAVANALASAEMSEATTTQAALSKEVPSASGIVLEKTANLPTVQEILARSAPIGTDNATAAAQLGEGAAFHATRTPAAAQSIIVNGIDPAYLNANSRFGAAFYVAEQPDTALAEMAHYGVDPTTGIRFSVNLSKSDVLDLTDPAVANAWGYSGGPITPQTQSIGQKALANGYKAIRYPSERKTGSNVAVLQDFNTVLKPVMVTPISK